MKSKAKMPLNWPGSGLGSEIKGKNAFELAGSGLWGGIKGKNAFELAWKWAREWNQREKSL
ncbi:hypothetical protein NST84_05105 [Paenibacillus sp. FSL R7-0345]|uniref:hypothetical protein n=1 Tax=Paenibacillus sp. FSL R7-0345 TaxID=2954535 RepID=UPI00315A4C7C